MKRIVFSILFSTCLAFFFGKARQQTDDFCYQRCQRTANPWTVMSLRLHLSKKLRIHPSEIVIPGTAGVIDVGSCNGNCRNGGECHASQRTAIVFEINSREFKDEDYYIIDSCSCSSEIHNTAMCSSPF